VICQRISKQRPAATQRLWGLDSVASRSAVLKYNLWHSPAAPSWYELLRIFHQAPSDVLQVERSKGSCPGRSKRQRRNRSALGRMNRDAEGD
jgi:hypothetical protein